MPRVEYEKLVQSSDAETSAQIQGRSEASRQIQRKRLESAGMITNSEMGPVEVWNFCKVEESAQGLLQAAMKQIHLSARGFHRVLKVTRTIADLGAPRLSASPT